MLVTAHRVGGEAPVPSRLHRHAYLCVDRSDVTTAGVCSCLWGVDEQLQPCSRQRTASGVLLRDYVIRCLNSPYMFVSWINYRAMEIEILYYSNNDKI